VPGRVNASDTIKSWLCGEKNLHRKVTGSRKTNDTLEKLINDPDLIVTTGAGKKMHKLSSVITPEFDLRIMFSVYGNKQKSVGNLFSSVVLPAFRIFPLLCWGLCLQSNGDV